MKNGSFDQKMLLLKYFKVYLIFFYSSKMKYGKINSSLNGYVKKGVMYATYSALIGESQSGGKYELILCLFLNIQGLACLYFQEYKK